MSTEQKLNNDDYASDSGDSVEVEAPEEDTTTTDPPNRYEKLERLKREKRLAMNRECARARRRRKKLRMELLENRVQELTQKNSRMQDANDALRNRVAQLEAELGVAKSGMGLSLSNPDGAGMGGGPPSSLLGARMGGMGGLSAAETQAMIAEKLNMQRRAAFAGLGAGMGAGSSHLGGLGNMGGMGAGAGSGSDQATALRYMQLMKAKSAASSMGADDSAMSAMQMPNASALLAAGMNPYAGSLLQQGGEDPTGLMY